MLHRVASVIPGAQLLSHRLAALTLTLVIGCSAQAQHSSRAVAELRSDASESQDPELLSRWALAELIAPGGEAVQAAKARDRLDQVKADTAYAHLARGIDDAFHGRVDRAPEHFLNAARLARESDEDEAPLIGWYATVRALGLNDSTDRLYRKWKPWVEQALKEPANLGWRARMELADWWGREAWRTATRDVQDLSAAQFGCAEHVRLAGPFGRNLVSDRFTSFAAERPGPWPAFWPGAESEPIAPHVLKTERFGCDVIVDEPVTQGIFYAETYFTLAEPQEVLIAVQGALQVWLNDASVLERDVRDWGIWTNFGVRVKLPAGRHRLNAKITQPSVSVMLMQPDGTPLGVESSADPGPGYELAAPSAAGQANVLMRFIGQSKVRAPRDELTRFIAAYLAHLDSQDDVASVLIEPLVARPNRATGPSLARAALFTIGDPIFDQTKTEDLVRELHRQAVERDPELWESLLHGAEHTAESKGLTEAVAPLRALVSRFTRVPQMGLMLLRVYGSLGWQPEYRSLVLELLERFPNDLEVLESAISLHDSEGNFKLADELIRRVHELNPDTEIDLLRSIEREDYDAALKELRRIQKRRPERKDIKSRILTVLENAGRKRESIQLLKDAIKQSPESGGPRLALADARYARGKHNALSEAIADAAKAGADFGALSQAVDLVEGMTELEPYRLAADPIIKAYEERGKHMPGTAARILDYSAIWVKADGSSRTLSHEIVRIQSAEAISKFAEHRRLGGHVLHMRVIKQDGRKLEPEVVSGKPTVTFPHLEVGDYIETEHITSSGGDGTGARYSGPRWFFREEAVAYARSEFVVISPKHKHLDIETQGDVPKPEVTHDGHFTVRRWRVDFSPAAPNEPMSPSAQEFLPSVAIGWGIRLEDNLERLAANLINTTPNDPRIVRIAQRIAEHLPAQALTERARALYRWVLSNVEEGEESDGRRAVVGKRGNRWRAFLTLSSALGIDATYALAKNRLASPAIGPISRASSYSVPVLHLEGRRGPVWLTVNNKYAPFGYIPAESRGMPAFLLAEGGPRPVTLPEGGALDSLVYAGKAKLSSGGSAKVELAQSFGGKYAISLRHALSDLPEARLHDVLESRLFGRILRGARLNRFELLNRDDLDQPLTVKMYGDVPGFARPRGKKLIIAPPFVPHLAQLASLPSRQTPMLIGESNHQRVELQVELPASARATLSQPRAFNNQGRSVVLKDRTEGNTLHLSRTVTIPPGRIAPEDYAAFAKFAREADAALSREIVISLE